MDFEKRLGNIGIIADMTLLKEFDEELMLSDMLKTGRRSKETD